MKFSNLNKQKKGITLIALVITIIVLLILAGVSIATLTGQNGILTKAQTVEKETTKGTEKEEIRLAYNAAIVDNLENENYTGGVTKDKLEAELGKQNSEAVVTGEETDIIVTYPTSKNEYKVNGKTGEITLKTTEKLEEFDESKYEGLENSIAKNTEKYGWLVKNYNVEYQDETTNESSTKWRLFYQDEKYTYLITDGLVGSYLPSDYYNKDEYLDGTKMSVVGQKLNGTVSQLFKDENNKANDNIRATVWFTDTENEEWAKYKDKNGDAVFAIASPTAELFEASYNNNTNSKHVSTYKKGDISVTLGSYGYYENTGSDWFKKEDSHGIYNKDNSSNWWLASPDEDWYHYCFIVDGAGRIFPRGPEYSDTRMRFAQ